MRKFLAVGAVVLGVIGLIAIPARPRPQAEPGPEAPDEREARRPLQAGTLSVRLLLGVGDEEPQTWGGNVAVDRGEIAGLEGWRFAAGAAVTGPDAWQARSLVARKAEAKEKAATKPAAKKKGAAAKKAGAVAGPAVTPTGVIVRLKAPADATLVVTTDQGEARIPLADLISGAPRRYLDGRIEGRLVPTHAPLATADEQEDFPAAAPDGRSGAWVAYVAHRPRGPENYPRLVEEPADFQGFVPSDGGDQVKLLHFNGTEVDQELEVTPAGIDAWRPAVALDGTGQVLVVWSELRAGNWDLYARRYDAADRSWTGQAERLTTDPGADTDVALATAPDGRAWMAWQAWRAGQADILLAPATEKSVSTNVSHHPANDWSPSLAIDASGRPYIAFDSYRAGSYDVLLYRGGENRGLVAVADSSRFEARPSLGVDARGRAWVAYEERPAHWGKDFGVHDANAGVPLYRDSFVRVRCVDGDKVLEAGDPMAQAPEGERRMNSFPRLALDGSGRPWLLYRHRQENNWRGSVVPVVGAVWYEYATTLVGWDWSPPRPVPRSDNLLDNRPALVSSGDGPVLAFYSTDGRLHNEGIAQQQQGGAARKKAQAKAAVAMRSWVNNDLFVAALSSPGGAAGPQPGDPVAEEEQLPPVHPNEAEDIARMRAHRVNAGGKEYRLLRGEFHRHTEISADGGGDGSLEDLWRYGLDVGGLDWIGCGDHDNGNGREYTWWMTQKTTDLYHTPPAFVPMFTYERSVNYPGGHRNVMFPRRGVRTLPRLVTEAGGPRIDVGGRDEDAQMLYKYLHELGGICAAHTSATDMGTDWRENDPAVEPFVEIYQGDRDSYEHLGAPRAAHNPTDAAGGWRPLGMVWNALALQYRLGFQSSSDHISTHISFAIAIAEEPTRAAIFDAFKKRHCYAATDNILLEVRCGEHLMGDEFTADGPVTLAVLAHGTAPIQRVDIVKDFHYAYSAEPHAARVEFRWTDEEPVNRHPSWYYVRVLQEDGEIAWGSPMWVDRPGSAAR